MLRIVSQEAEVDNGSAVGEGVKCGWQAHTAAGRVEEWPAREDQHRRGPEDPWAGHWLG